MIRLGCLFLTLLFVGSSVSPGEAATSPNVIIVMTDDQGLGDFSFMGNPILKTPNFDAFARQSVRLTDFHVAPMCSPTRGQLITGLASLRNGATSVTAGRTFLRPGLATMPQHFARAGYRTGLFGKWHLGDSYPHRPVDKGFQESRYHLGWGQFYSTPEFDWPLIDGRYFENGVEKRYKGHCTDFWFDSATEWIKKCADDKKPFFCYIPTNAPHSPYVELDSYVEPYRGKGPAGFFGMIAHVDKRFGDLMAFLDREKLADNTIVIFMTDNGGTSGVATFNAGLRAGKTTYYDGGHRVPCWIRWPEGKLGSPRDIDVPTQNTDLFPTLCRLCNLDAPTWKADCEAYHGTDLTDLLRGATDRLPDRKLVVQYGQIPQEFDCCVIWNQWRLVKGTELYDVHKDRAQKHDVARDHPEVVASLRSFYQGWWNGVEPLVQDFVPISIGAEAQPVVELTSGDWENIYADNAGHVRLAVGGPTGGRWHLNVEKAGDYEFTLRRWPERAHVPLGAKYEPDRTMSNIGGNVKTVGFPTIGKASVEATPTGQGEIAAIRKSATADPNSLAETVTLRLPAGRVTFKAWFSESNGTNLCGAYFVTVRRK